MTYPEHVGSYNLLVDHKCDYAILVTSSVAMGEGGIGGTRPLQSTGMATGFVQIRGDFSFGGEGVGGRDSSPPDS